MERKLRKEFAHEIAKKTEVENKKAVRKYAKNILKSINDRAAEVTMVWTLNANIMFFMKEGFALSWTDTEAAAKTLEYLTNNGDETYTPWPKIDARWAHYWRPAI